MNSVKDAHCAFIPK